MQSFISESRMDKSVISYEALILFIIKSTSSMCAVQHRLDMSAEPS